MPNYDHILHMLIENDEDIYGWHFIVGGMVFPVSFAQRMYYTHHLQQCSQIHYPYLNAKIGAAWSWIILAMLSLTPEQSFTHSMYSRLWLVQWATPYFEVIVIKSHCASSMTCIVWLARGAGGSFQTFRQFTCAITMIKYNGSNSSIMQSCITSLLFKALVWAQFTPTNCSYSFNTIWWHFLHTT